MKAENSRLADLDILRFFAAICVVFLHYGVRGFAAGDIVSPLHFPTFGPLVKYNYLAVDLFFMISGFVILMSASGGRGWKAFAASRIVRLLPAYWVSCSMTFFVVYFFARGAIYTSVGRYLLNMTMLNGLFGIGPIDGPYWTLLIEIKFYIVVGCLLAIRRLDSIYIVGVFWIALSALNFLIPLNFIEGALFLDYAPFFISGIVFYLVYDNGWRLSYVAALVAAIFTGYEYETRILAEKALHYGLPFDRSVLLCILLAFNVVFSLIASGMSLPVSSKARVWFGVLGAISYPLYLLHNNIGMVIFNRFSDDQHRWFWLFIVILMVAGLSYIVHRYFERPISRRLRSYLNARLV